MTLSVSHDPGTSTGPYRTCRRRIVADVAERSPESLALTGGSVGAARTWTDAELLDLSEQAAVWLLERVEPNERLLENGHVTDAGMVRTMLVVLLEHDASPQQTCLLGVLTCGGATIPDELVRRVESELSVRVSNAFGQAEAAPVISQTYLNDSPRDKTGSFGRSPDDAECKIVE